MNGQLSLLLISPDIKARRNLIEHISNLQLFAIDTAFDSAEAIAKLKQNEYHFIISDIHIGEVDAWCLSSLIRSDIYKCDRKTPSYCWQIPTVRKLLKQLQNLLALMPF
jgi:CheY-like chemotaxis protein